MNPNLRERFDKSIVGKPINAKIYFGCGAPITQKKISNLLISLERNSINQSLEISKKEVNVNAIDEI